MRLFKKKIVKEIDGGVWGHLVSEHGIDVDTLCNRMRCVEREGFIDKIGVTLIRVFKPSEAEQKGVPVMGWETFDEHPDLVIFEGYLTKQNKAHLERKRT
jgi:hypothetical protein